MQARLAEIIVNKTTRPRSMVCLSYKVGEKVGKYGFYVILKLKEKFQRQSEIVLL
jgi:hypothetical protein